jgi:hypothetical protein
MHIRQERARQLQTALLQGKKCNDVIWGKSVKDNARLLLSLMTKKCREVSGKGMNEFWL